MVIKAACIGINKYRESPLQGCVNDVLDIYNHFKQFTDPDNLRILLDERATRDAIPERLKWLVDNCEPGDHLFYHFSGHGTRIRSWSWDGTLGDLCSCIVPYDYDWNDDNSFIFDENLHEELHDLPEGVDLTFIFDSCHSGGMDDTPRGIAETNRSSSKIRYLNPPLDVEIRYRDRNLRIRDLGYKWLQPDYQESHRTLAACQEEQTASDSMFDGRYNGAFTWAFLKSLKIGEARTWLQVMEDAQKLLKTEGFSQVPIIRAQPKAINTYPLH
jgi:hypothetical protein